MRLTMSLFLTTLPFLDRRNGQITKYQMMNAKEDANMITLNQTGRPVLLALS